MPDSATDHGATASTAEILQRIDAVAPVIEGEADASEAQGHLTQKLVDALHEAKLFRLLMPKPFNGEEVTPPTFMQAIERVARHDASTAWCLCQGNGCSMSAAIAQPDVARLIWGDDPAGVLAWGPGKATAVPVKGGYSVTCDLAFCSGMHNATWLGAHCMVLEDGEPRKGADGKTEVRTMLIPKSEIEINIIWDVIGLRATGSDGYALKDHFVPAAHSVIRDKEEELIYRTPLYLFRQTNLYAAGFSGVAMGIAYSMLQAFKKLSIDKRPRLAKTVLKENAVVQADVALAEARLNAARTFLISELDDIWAAVLETGELTVDQRMRIRLATTHGIHEAKSVADAVYDAAGATAVFHSSPFERRYRDIRTVTQQMQGRKAHYQTVGNYLLGGEPDLSSV
jgi:indole-3-acetate monooxygenase